MKKITHIEDGIFSATFGKHVDVDKVQRNLLTLADQGLITFGHINTEILPFENVEPNDLCLFDDETLGLAMPNTWYLNKGTNAISIPMYYNFLGYKEMAKEGRLFEKNAHIASTYGRIAMIELYWQSDVESFLEKHSIPYFGTPKTLTECMRVLEGWDLTLVPRLYSYVGFAGTIREWCKKNFAGYIDDLWEKTRAENDVILKEEGTTNIRKGITEYWKKVLLNKTPKVTPGDVELDILSYSFYEKRQPAIILIGENIFSETETDAPVAFKRFSVNDQHAQSFRSFEKNDMPLANARLARKHFPNSKIILLNTEPGLPNFSLCKMDEIKQGISLEVAQVAELLCNINSIT